MKYKHDTYKHKHKNKYVQIYIYDSKRDDRSARVILEIIALHNTYYRDYYIQL